MRSGPIWSWLSQLSLFSGVLPLVITITGALAAAFLLLRPGTWWWGRVVPGAVILTAGSLIVLQMYRPFVEPLPVRVLVWIGVGVLSVGLTVATLFSARWWRRAAVVPALILVLAVATVKVNAYYSFRPTLSDALALPAANEIDIAALPRARPLQASRGDQPVAATWQPPPDMPPTGKVFRADIPGPVSGFAARPGWVYVPPAYLASRRPLLPVLVLLAGIPGGPRDWLAAGRLAEIMDRFAATHRGLAPVVVIPDASGANLADPLCLDSRLGNAETYLAIDVPAWVNANLQVNPDPRRRAIAGYSYGGTCALQLAVRRPQLYPTFLDIAGDPEPTLGTRKRTVDAAFGGDESKFRAVNPMDLLATTSYPGSEGIIAVGSDNTTDLAQAQRVSSTAQRANMAVTLTRYPGGHTWAVAKAALIAALPRLATRLNLTDATTP